MRRWRAAVLALALAGAVAALYWPVLGYDFVSFDDSRYVSENPFFRDGLTLHSLGEAFSPMALQDRDHLWIPLTWISLMADRSLFGPDPLGFHLTNLLLFATAFAGFFFLLYRMTGETALSLLVAAVAACHPLRVESVAWVTERKDCLALLFLVLALGAHLRVARGGGWRWSALLALLALMGLWSKPNLVVLPVLLIVLDFWPLGRVAPGKPGWLARAGQLVVEKVPLLLLSGAFAAFTLSMQRGNIHPFALSTRLTLAFTSPFIYLRKTLWPADLHLAIFDLASVPPMSLGLAAFAALGAMSWLVLRLAPQRPWLAAGWLWYLAALAPNSGIFPNGTQWLADRFTLLPHLGLFVALTWEAASLAGGVVWRRNAAQAAALALLALLSLGTRWQLPVWRDTVSLWGRSVAVAPDSSEYRQALGAALLERGKRDAGLNQIAAALRLDPWHDLANFNMGFELDSEGRAAAAIPFYERSWRTGPGNPRPALRLAEIHLAAGRMREAGGLYRELAGRFPNTAEGAFAAGRLLAMEGREAEAGERYRRALVPPFANSESSYDLQQFLAR